MAASAKLSISLSLEDERYVRRTAKRLGTTVSSVIATTIEERRRAEARDELLARLGADDISEADRDGMRRELHGKADRARRHA